MATCIGEKIEVNRLSRPQRGGWESEWRESGLLREGDPAKLTAVGRAPRCFGRVSTAGGPAVWGRSVPPLETGGGRTGESLSAPPSCP